MNVEYKIIDLGIEWLLALEHTEVTFNELAKLGFLYVDMLMPGTFLFVRKNLGAKFVATKKRSYHENARSH